MRALVVFAHGSPVEAANAPIRELARHAAERAGFPLTQAAFLDSTEPSLTEALAQLVEAGATDVTVVPFFLTVGLHIRRDLPGIVEGLRDKYATVRIQVTEPLEGHPALLDMVVDRAEKANNGGSRSESQAR
jgi:sirohydrochlorin ferrochelatase